MSNLVKISHTSHIIPILLVLIDAHTGSLRSPVGFSVSREGYRVFLAEQIKEGDELQTRNAQKKKRI